MDQRFAEESARLAAAWEQLDSQTLGSYLVEDVQDPRINVPSILTRHLLVRRLFGDRYEYLMEQELRFGLVVNWLMRLLKDGVSSKVLRSVLHALIAGQRQAEGLEIPRYVSETFEQLAVPNYICDLFSWAPVETTESPIAEALAEALLSTFEKIWAEELAETEPSGLQVLELACGSANDYRFLERFGLARLIEYVGFDLCEKNIRNAKCMYPAVRFEVGNGVEIDAAADCYDVCFVHDLFEHLSVVMMERAIEEVCRVSREQVWVGFFNMYEGDEHIVQFTGRYHWNRLSAELTKRSFERFASSVEVISIHRFLRSNFGCDDTESKNAYMFVVKL